MRLTRLWKILLNLIEISLLALIAACSSLVRPTAPATSTPTPVSTPATVTPAPFIDRRQPTEPAVTLAASWPPTTEASPSTTLRHSPFLYVEAQNEDYYLARMDADGSATRLVQLPDFLRATADGPRMDVARNGQQVVFSTLSDSIYTVQADGSGVTRLLSDGWHGHVPLWSPDGAWLAFVGGAGEQSDDLYVMRADGSALRRVTPEAMGVESVFNQPVWLADSACLLFVGVLSTEENSYPNLYTVQIDGTGLTCLTCNDPVPAPPCCGFPFQITLSPTAPEIAYRWLDGNLYLLELTTGQRRPLTTPSVTGMGLHWSPDGQWLAFRGEAEAGFGTFAAKVDGTGLLQPLILGDLNVTSWSPDGQKLALSQVETTGTQSSLSYQFSIIAFDTRQVTPLFLDSAPITGTEGEVWTPDSQQLLYTISLDEQQADVDFYLVNADSHQFIRLTDNPGYKTFVAWVPPAVQ